MRIGKWVPLYKRTVPIPRRLSMAFGLYEGSELYLVPLPDEDTERKYGCEVIVSPVAIRSWRTVCRLSIRLHDRPGALAKAAGFLRQQRINILLSECTSTYQRRAHWDAVCDISLAPGVEILLGVDRLDYEHEMARFLQTLTTKFERYMEAQENREAFLLARERHVQFSTITGLNDASFVCDFKSAARLSHRAGALELSEQTATYISRASHFEPPLLPRFALVTGNTEQRYMRVLFLKDHRHMFRLVIEDELAEFAGGGIGVLQQLLHNLPESVNLFRASNYVTEKRENVERGRIDLIGHWNLDEAEIPEADRFLRDRIESMTVLDMEGKEHSSVFSVKRLANPEAMHPRVFISYSIGRDRSKLQMLRHRLIEDGFEPVLGTDFGSDGGAATIGPRPVTSDVAHAAFEGIHTCVAFVSLHVKREDYHVQNAEADRYVLPAWSIAEEVFAWSSNVGLIVRLRDATVDEAPYNRNTLTKTFASDEDFEQAVEDVLAELNAFRLSPRFAQVEEDARLARFRKRFLPRE